MRYIAFCLALTSLVVISPAHAQTLGDIARAEEARRAKITQPAKVYTDKDLVAPRDVPAPMPPLPAPAIASPTPIEIVTTTKAAPKDEGYWKDRMRVLQAQLEADQTFEREAAERERRLNEQAHRDAAQSRFTTDRQQLSGATRAWQDAVAEVGRLRAAIINDKRAIMSLEEEARRAGVLPGWLLP